MNALDLTSLRAGLPECPSDFALDRLHGGELEGEAEAELRAHVRGCTACAVRVEQRRQGFAALPGVDPVALLARVERARPPAPSLVERVRALLLRPSLGFAAVASLALALLMVWRTPDGKGEPAAGVRSKGGLTLHVHRLRGEHSHETVSGERFFPGDRLRFSVDVPGPGYLAILGVESDGDLYTAWPLGEAPSPTHRQAGPGQLLDGAVTLDDAQGLETLYAVHCPQAEALRGCTVSAARELRCEAACSVTPFTLDKRP